MVWVPFFNTNLGSQSFKSHFSNTCWCNVLAYFSCGFRETGSGGVISPRGISSYNIIWQHWLSASAGVGLVASREVGSASKSFWSMKHNRPHRLPLVAIISEHVLKERQQKLGCTSDFFFHLHTNHHHRWDRTGHRFMTGCIPVAVDHFCLAFGSFYVKLSGPPSLNIGVINHAESCT